MPIASQVNQKRVMHGQESKNSTLKGPQTYFQYKALFHSSKKLGFLLVMYQNRNLF